MPDYPNAGPDSRLDLFGILRWAQNFFSFHSKTPPKWIVKFTGRFQYWFPEKREYVSLGIAWPPYFVWQGVAEQGFITDKDSFGNPIPKSPEHPDGLKWLPGKVSMVRAGWRFDPNWEGGGYIFPTVAIKVRSVPFPMEAGY